jgi:CRISPR/Cas system CSM-associated protein Csm2 small subunit
MILIPGLKVWGVQWNLKETKTRNFYPETIDQEVNSSSEEIVRSKTCLTVKSADDDY